MQRQPDALEPDDQHELEAAPGDRAQQGGEVAAGEHRVAEEPQREHGFGDPALDHAEHAEHGGAAEQPGQDPRVGPAHGVPAVGLDAVGDRGEQRGQADGEGDVAPPVDAARAADAGLAQRAVGPDGADHADRHVHPEDGPPVPLGEQSAEHEPDEGAGDRGHHVDAQGHAALPGGEGVGDDRGGVRHQHGAADRLHHPPADQPERTAPALERVEGEDDRGEGEDQEAGVVDPHPAPDVAEPSEGDHEHRRDQHVAHQHPQQVADVAGPERVQVDAVEDRGQRDQHDRGVDRGDQHAQRGVGERHPFVARVVRVDVHRPVLPRMGRAPAGPGII